MKTMNKTVLVILSLFLMAVSGVVSASCTQSDAKGTWRIHGVVWDISGFDSTASFKCKVKVGSGGSFSGSTSSCKIFSQLASAVIGGKLVMSSNCAISGKLKTVAGDIKFRSGQMDRSKKSFTIVGVDPLNTLFEFYLDGKKQ